MKEPICKNENCIIFKTYIDIFILENNKEKDDVNNIEKINKRNLERNSSAWTVLAVCT